MEKKLHVQMQPGVVRVGGLLGRDIRRDKDEVDVGGTRSG